MVIACDGFSRISGHVYDIDEQPISDAAIVFEAVEKGQPVESYQDAGKTNESGRFALGFVDSPFDHKLRLSVRKEGYKSYTTEMNTSDARKMMNESRELKIVLEKE